MTDDNQSDAPSGLAAIYEAMRGELLRFLTARTGDTGEAEDLLQDLWVRIQAPQGGPIGNARAYLYRTAHNLVLDRARGRQRRLRRDGDWSATQRLPIAGEEPADNRPAPDDALIVEQEIAALAAAIAALPPAAGHAFRLHKLEGVPHAEVAARLGISRSGVEKHIALAMAHLRRALLAAEGES